MVKLLSKVIDCTERWVELYEKASDNPTLTSDSEWRDAFRNMAEEMQMLSVETCHLPDPLPEFCLAHDRVICAVSHYADAAKLSILWLDTDDLETLAKTVLKIDLGNAAMMEAATLMLE